MVRMYEFLSKIGVNKPQYLCFAKRLSDFFTENFSESYGFGKSWTLDGECTVKNGSIGGFMLMGILETYRLTKTKRYLDCAIKAHDFYYKRDLNNFVCTAGALDCACIDKETAYPFIKAALLLYEFTGDKKYIHDAEKAAYYFFSWAFHYDVLYPKDSDFARYGYYTTGGTAISAEHHAIDAWGAAPVTEFVQLYKLTGEEKWLTCAKMMWCNAILGITSVKNTKIHGQIRPIGSQNEGFFHCRWTKYRPTCEERGHFNDCLAAWCGAYRMMTLERLISVAGEKSWHILE